MSLFGCGMHSDFRHKYSNYMADIRENRAEKIIKENNLGGKIQIIQWDEPLVGFQSYSICEGDTFEGQFTLITTLEKYKFYGFNRRGFDKTECLMQITDSAGQVIDSTDIIEIQRNSYYTFGVRAWNHPDSTFIYRGEYSGLNGNVYPPVKKPDATFYTCFYSNRKKCCWDYMQLTIDASDDLRINLGLILEETDSVTLTRSSCEYDNGIFIPVFGTKDYIPFDLKIYKGDVLVLEKTALNGFEKIYVDHLENGEYLIKAEDDESHELKLTITD